MKLVNAAEYGVLREGLLSKLGHIALPMDALLYQAGCCRIDGGGMYLVGAPAGPAALCAEGTGDKTARRRSGGTPGPSATWAIAITGASAWTRTTTRRRSGLPSPPSSGIPGP